MQKFITQLTVLAERKNYDLFLIDLQPLRERLHSTHHVYCFQLTIESLQCLYLITAHGYRTRKEVNDEVDRLVSRIVKKRKIVTDELKYLGRTE